VETPPTHCDRREGDVKQGLHVVGLCAGVGAVARAAVTAGVKLIRLAHCDVDGVATQTATELRARLRMEATHVTGKGAARGMVCHLPTNILDVTHSVIEKYCLACVAPDFVE
jgi:hypothetical protein